MYKLILFVLIISIISCKESSYKFVPYEFKINSNCQAKIIDSILVLKYSIQNLDSINYYIPGSEIWFSGSLDGNYTFASSPGNIYSRHFINYFPLNTMFQAFFELNSKYFFSRMPYFYVIKPNESFELTIEILPQTQALGKIVYDFNCDMDYNIISKFSIMNEVDFIDLINKLNLNNDISRIKIDNNNNQIFLSSFSKDNLKKLNFETTNIKIDSKKSELINDYLQNHIDVKGVLINQK